MLQMFLRLSVRWLLDITGLQSYSRIDTSLALVLFYYVLLLLSDGMYVPLPYGAPSGGMYFEPNIPGAHTRVPSGSKQHTAAIVRRLRHRMGQSLELTDSEATFERHQAAKHRRGSRSVTSVYLEDVDDDIVQRLEPVISPTAAADKHHAHTESEAHRAKHCDTSLQTLFCYTSEHKNGDIRSKQSSSNESHVKRTKHDNVIEPLSRKNRTEKQERDAALTVEIDTVSTDSHDSLRDSFCSALVFDEKNDAAQDLILETCSQQGNGTWGWG